MSNLITVRDSEGWFGVEPDELELLRQRGQVVSRGDFFDIYGVNVRELLPIYGAKLTFNSSFNKDEPPVLVDREHVGNLVSLFIRDICQALVGLFKFGLEVYSSTKEKRSIK